MIKYRPDIDGLRAVAIAAILLYHVDASWLPGGYVGVDVFFVISGFLITSIILRDIGAHRFSIMNFYERRIRRIVPGLFCMFLACFCAGYIVLLPDDFTAFCESMIHATASISNIHFLNAGGGYFDNLVTEVPLLHTWSLSVEEQFYFGFPFLLVLLHRWFHSKRAMTWVIIAIAGVSFAASVYYVFHKPQKAFFLLPFRAWELAAGALLALAGRVHPGSRTGNAIGSAGMALIAGSMVFFKESTPFPGAAALLPCAGTVMLIAAGGNERVWTTRLLSLKPLVALGLISYSVYLWHWPLITLTRYAGIGIAPHPAILVAGSLAIGAASWWLVERPFRKPGLLKRKGVFLSWAVSGAALIAAAAFVMFKDGLPGRFSPEVQALLAYKKGPLAEIDRKQRFELFSRPVEGDLSVEPSIVVWGDSHAEVMMPLIGELVKERKRSVRRFGAGAVAPVLGIARKGQARAGDIIAYSDKVMAYVTGNSAIKTVVLHARWSLYTHGRNEDHDEFPEFHGHRFGSRAELEEFYASRIRLTVKTLLDAGKQVVIIYPVPETGINIPDYLAKHALAGTQLPETIRLADFHRRNDRVIAALDSAGAGDARVLRVRPYEKLMAGDKVAIMGNGKPLYFDDDHLGAPGLEFVRPMMEEIFPKLD